MTDRAAGLQDEPRLRWLAGGIFAASTIVVALLHVLGFLQALELAIYDAILSLRAGGDRDRVPTVAVVLVSEDDLKAWGWPLPDDRLAELGLAIRKAGARAVGIDIYRDRAVPPSSGKLAALFSDPFVIGISKLASDSGPPIAASPALEKAGRFGFSDLPVDRDGKVRRSLLLVQQQGRTILSFALRMAMATISPDGRPQLRPAPGDPRTLMIGSTPLPKLAPYDGGYAGVDARGYQMLIDYRTPPGIIPVVSASSLVADPATGEPLRDKLVVLGTASESVKDLFLAPVANAQGTNRIPGALMHAAAIDQFVRFSTALSKPARFLPLWVEVVLVALASAGGAFAAWHSHSAGRLIAGGPLLGIAATIVAASALFIDRWIPAAAVGTAWILSFSLLAGATFLIIFRRQRMLQALFSTHMSPALAAEVWRNRELFLAGGRPKPLRLAVTVLFADLAGSTRIGGTMSPAVFVEWVGRFLDRLASVAGDHGGLVDKFTGDGIMVVFGAPVPRASPEEQAVDAVAACRCALAMAEAVDVLNRDLGGQPSYSARIGIHSGNVLGGSFGNSSRMQYTIIGDAANVAARMEAFGKKLAGTHSASATICISEDTLALIGPGWKAKQAGVFLHDDGHRHINVHLLTAAPSATNFAP
jgi:adenylate cyclase